MALSALLFWSLVSTAPSVEPAPPPPASPTSVDVSTLWERRCQQCHGADGRAHTRTGQRENIDDFTSQDWQAANSDEHLRETITEGSKGNAKMKSFKTLL